jgi:hypothetical protein
LKIEVKFWFLDTQAQKRNMKFKLVSKRIDKGKKSVLCVLTERSFSLQA